MKCNRGGVIPQETINNRKRIIYEALENVPGHKYATLDTLQRYLDYCGEKMDKMTLLSFLTNFCLDVYEDDDYTTYGYGLTEEHVFSAPPDAEHLLVLMEMYKDIPVKKNKKKVSA